MTDRDKVERAPERIWAGETDPYGAIRQGIWQDTVRGLHCPNEFVRADLFTALQAERDALLAKVQELGTEGHAYRKGKLAGYEAGKQERDPLREALKPFAAMAALYDPEDGDDNLEAWASGARPTIGQLRAARAALHQTERDG